MVHILNTSKSTDKKASTLTQIKSAYWIQIYQKSS
uniref:Uncharacterized protein n=1 Tax=Arundo donax TaxID=35708 RepID=A0A0A9GNE0_ARUDO